MMKHLAIDFGLILRLLKKSASEWMSDNAMRLSAALSYYSVFSIAPLLLIAIGLAGFVFGAEAAQGKVTQQLGQFIGQEAGEAVQTMVKSASKSSGKATAVGVVVLLFGASTVFGQLKEALNAIWGVRAKPGLGIWGLVRERLLSFGMVLVIGFLLLVSLALSTALAALNGWMEGYLHLPKFLSAIFGFVLPLGVETVLFALVFQILPDARIRWRCVWLGAVVTALLFEVGKTGLAWYLGQASTTSSFGAAGSLVVLLLWVFYASCILFFGAEFTKVYAAEAKAWIEPTHVAERTPKCEGVVATAPAKVGAEPSPLHPDDPVPALPMKESLAPLLVSPEVESLVLRESRLPRQIARPMPEPGNRWEQWMQVVRDHPAAQIGAAVGVGLVAGTISRMLERRTPTMTAPEHFAQGSRKTAQAGQAMLATLAGWMADHVTRRELVRYARTARDRGAHWRHDVAARLEKATR
jgi:membrane protein